MEFWGTSLAPASMIPSLSGESPQRIERYAQYCSPRHAGHCEALHKSVDLLPGVSAGLELKLATVNAAETPFKFEIVRDDKTIRAASYTLWVTPPMRTVVAGTQVPVGTKQINWSCEWLSKPAPDRLTVRMELYTKDAETAITAIDCTCYKGRKAGAFLISELPRGAICD